MNGVVEPSADGDLRFQAHANHGTLREFDLLAFGGGNRPAAADRHADRRTFRAAEDAANDGADTRTGRHAFGLTLDARPFQRLRDNAPDRVRLTANRQLVECERHLRGAVGAGCRLHGGDDASQARSRAVLAALDARGGDRVVCLGDVVGYNAEPNECAALLVERGIETIAGNHDLIALGRLGSDRCADKPAFTLRRTRKVPSDTCRTYLAALPSWLPLETDVVLIHGGVNDAQEYVTTRDRVLDNCGRPAALAPGARICFFGHTHEQKLYRVRQGTATECPARGVAMLDRDESTYFINPGSIDASRKAEPRLAESGCPGCTGCGSGCGYADGTSMPGVGVPNGEPINTSKKANNTKLTVTGASAAERTSLADLIRLRARVKMEPSSNIVEPSIHASKASGRCSRGRVH